MIGVCRAIIPDNKPGCSAADPVIEASGRVLTVRKGKKLKEIRKYRETKNVIDQDSFGVGEVSSGPVIVRTPLAEFINCFFVNVRNGHLPTH